MDVWHGLGRGFELTTCSAGASSYSVVATALLRHARPKPQYFVFSDVVEFDAAGLPKIVCFHTENNDQYEARPSRAFLQTRIEQFISDVPLAGPAEITEIRIQEIRLVPVFCLKDEELTWKVLRQELPELYRQGERLKIYPGALKDVPKDAKAKKVQSKDFLKKAAHDLLHPDVQKEMLSKIAKSFGFVSSLESGRKGRKGGKGGKGRSKGTGKGIVPEDLFPDALDDHSEHHSDDGDDGDGGEESDTSTESFERRVRHRARRVNTESVADHTGSRDFRITEAMLEKFGYTPGCPGCDAKQGAPGRHRPHTQECRAYIEQCLVNKGRQEIIEHRNERRNNAE